MTNDTALNKPWTTIAGMMLRVRAVRYPKPQASTNSGIGVGHTAECAAANNAAEERIHEIVRRGNRLGGASI